MLHESKSAPRRATRGHFVDLVQDESGVVVVVPLFIVVVVLVTMVIAGKLLFPSPEPYVAQTRPSLSVAVSSGVVYADGHAVRRIAPGDTVWVVRAGNGLPVVFTDSTGAEVLGVADARLRPIDRP